MKPSTVSVSTALGIWLAVGLLAASLMTVTANPAQSREGDRTLRLYHLHTGERGEFTFKRNGQFDRGELTRLNTFLRDWRKAQPITMDPHLFDLIWSIYRESGSNGYISVVCGYRTVGTNDMLRSRGRGVASHSQHSLGKAMDFFIPGVPLAKLRAIAMKFQGGGVGFYPTSGSPFVHVDTGHVRMWPRMSRQQLLALFPSGDTLYIPADGKPLQGYQRALARAGSSGGTALAYLDTGSDDGDSDNGGGGGWLKRVFGGGKSQDKAAAPTAVAALPAPTPAPSAVAAVAAPEIREPTVDIVPPVETASVELPSSPRLPKARPVEASAVDVAALIPPAPVEAPAAQEELASLAFAPLPRTRPDPTLLVDSLQTRVNAPAALSVGAEDAMAALASHAEVAEPSPDASVPAQVALAAPQVEPVVVVPVPAAVQPSAAVSVPLPRPRPLALASLDVGMSKAQVSAATLRVQAAPDLLQVRLATAAANAAVALSHSGKGNRSAAPKLRLRAPGLPTAIVAQRTQDRAFGGFAMPQPAGVTALFAVPGSAAEVAAASWSRPRLPTGRFEIAEAQTGARDQSFFSRLFASLTE